MDATAQSTRSTRERILRTAETLFAESGFNATSLRHITQAANVNLASVNYHFGTKKELLKELIRERVSSVNEQRLERLRQCRCRENGKPFQLRPIVEAYVVPMVQAKYGRMKRESSSPKLICHIQTEMPAFMEEMHREFFQPVQEKFLEAIREAVPEVDERELFWRFHFAIVLILGAVGQRSRLMLLSRGQCDGEDIEETTRKLIEFICAGITAPAIPACQS